MQINWKKLEFSGKLFTVQALWCWKKKATPDYTRLPVIMIDMFWINSDETSKKKFEIVDDNELWDLNEKSPCCVNMREAVSVAQ